MRKIVFALFCASFFITTAFSQAKKPTIMVVPSDAWCIKNGYVLEFDNQGTKVKIPDYKKAYQENTDLLLVISKINGLMAERGFPLKNMESVIKTLESESAENALLSSKSGAGVVETPIDKLKKTAKADIIMQLTWTLNSTGPKKSVTFNLQGLDAYTDKQVANATGTGATSFSVELPVLLEEAVLAHIDKWMTANTVKERFSTTDATENMMLFEQVRIPLFDANGKATDARGFLKGLQSFLKAAPYNIPNKLMMKGLGQAVIVLGEK